jgi:hypothetical protein
MNANKNKNKKLLEDLEKKNNVKKAENFKNNSNDNLNNNNIKNNVSNANNSEAIDAIEIDFFSNDNNAINNQQQQNNNRTLTISNENNATNNLQQHQQQQNNNRRTITVSSANNSVNYQQPHQQQQQQRINDVGTPTTASNSTVTTAAATFSSSNSTSAHSAEQQQQQNVISSDHTTNNNYIHNINSNDNNNSNNNNSKEEELIEKEILNNNSTSTTTLAKIIEKQQEKATTTTTTTEEIYCLICAENLLPSKPMDEYIKNKVTDVETRELKCASGHGSCINCWKIFLKIKIIENGDGCLPCLQFKCGEILDIQWAPVLLNNQEFVNRFLMQRQRHAIDLTGLKYCPIENCGLLVYFPSRNNIIKHTVPQSLFCANGHSFCLECMQEAHSPCTCEHFQNWKKQIFEETKNTNFNDAGLGSGDGKVASGDDIANALWVAANTKRCPRCSTPIEKDEGCNHMWFFIFFSFLFFCYYLYYYDLAFLFSKKFKKKKKKKKFFKYRFLKKKII